MASPKKHKRVERIFRNHRVLQALCKNYGKIAKPLTQLLKKDNFNWSKEAQIAFDNLRTAMTLLLVLTVLDFSKPFVVETDASSKGIGAVLLQEERAVAFLSQRLSDKAQNKSVYERELMVVVMAIQKWRHYLIRRHFVIHTNQRSLKYFNEQHLLSEE